METGAIIGTIDVAQVVLYVFWIFFAGLLIYLQRETRREGYPLVSEVDGAPMDHGVWMPGPKTFTLADGSTVIVPQPEKDVQPTSMEPAMEGTGMPYMPVGDPMLAGVGPGAYTPRSQRPDVTYEGHPRVLPLRALPGFSISEADPDPRGMTVYGADGEEAGTVVDAWVDRSDMLLRYFEVELRAGNVLMPVNFTQIDGNNRTIFVNAILGSQFVNVPALTTPDLVTMDEEERICAYFGAGMLYATPQRQETLI